MADLAHASENDTDLHGDPDAAHWAERFARVRHNVLTGPERRDIAADEGAMLSWFAGAIETGRMVREATEEMMVADVRAPLYLQVPELVADPPVAVECPICFAIVRAARLDDHTRASHG